jgi:hypothetical protein
MQRASIYDLIIKTIGFEHATFTARDPRTGIKNYSLKKVFPFLVSEAQHAPFNPPPQFGNDCNLHASTRPHNSREGAKNMHISISQFNYFYNFILLFRFTIILQLII